MKQHVHMSLYDSMQAIALYIDSVAEYCVKLKECSCIGGYLYLDSLAPLEPQQLNVSILVECKTLYHVAAEGAEAEVNKNITPK